MRFDDILKRGKSIALLLREAGMRPEYVKEYDRTFASNWVWDDGQTQVATVWRDEVRDIDETPWVSYINPSLRTDLSGRRRSSAQTLFDVLASHTDRPIRVILQTKKEDPKKWKNGKSEKRGLDAEPWFATVDGDTVKLQRERVSASKVINLDGQPMPERIPSYSLREVRQDQIKFRERVSAKTGGRCALTGAPSEVCEAAHFPWANWRSDNEAHHGILLRCDLHAALDCGLLDIDGAGRVTVSKYLASRCNEYRDLHGREVPV